MIPHSYYLQSGCWSCKKAMCLGPLVFCLQDGTRRPPVPNSSYQYDSFREAAWDVLEKWEAAHKVEPFGSCSEWEGSHSFCRASCS